MTTVEPIRNLQDIKKVENILKCQNKRNLLLFTLGTNCGLRISDILSLDVSDVKNKKFIELIEKKTGKYKRFPINSKLKPMLEEFTANKDINSPLFLTKFGNRLTRISAYFIVRDACRKAGIDYKIGTHTMRKTFGYHHYKKFKDVAILQKILNHSNPEVTLRYIGIDQDEIYKSYENFIL